MAIFTSEDIIQAAQAIRPYLVHLLGDQNVARKVGIRMDMLLENYDRNEGVDNLILAELAQYPETREWMKKALGSSSDNQTKGDLRLPGKTNPIPASQKFICPEIDCNFTWIKRYSTQPIPPCPQHNGSLTLAP